MSNVSKNGNALAVVHGHHVDERGVYKELHLPFDLAAALSFVTPTVAHGPLHLRMALRMRWNMVACYIRYSLMAKRHRSLKRPLSIMNMAVAELVVSTQDRAGEGAR